MSHLEEILSKALLSQNQNQNRNHSLQVSKSIGFVEIGLIRFRPSGHFIKKKKNEYRDFGYLFAMIAPFWRECAVYKIKIKKRCEEEETGDVTSTLPPSSLCCSFTPIDCAGAYRIIRPVKCGQNTNNLSELKGESPVSSRIHGVFV